MSIKMRPQGPIRHITVSNLQLRFLDFVSIEPNLRHQVTRLNISLSL